MALADDEQGTRTLPGLTAQQTGIAFLLMSSALIVYVAYQIHIGRVFTKSGDMALTPGLPWAWLTIESVAAIVGAVRGYRMLGA